MYDAEAVQQVQEMKEAWEEGRAASRCKVKKTPEWFETEANKLFEQATRMARAEIKEMREEPRMGVKKIANKSTTKWRTR